MSSNNNNHSRLFCFDLDGTVTRQEILPLIAGELSLERELQLLTSLTIKGVIPFEDSFRLRCAILRSVPISTVKAIVSSVELHPGIEEFIKANKERVVLVTGNLDVWIEPIAKKLGCMLLCSKASVDNDQLVGVETVLRKGPALLELNKNRHSMVAIGESFNDISMFEIADTSIAFGGVHDPVPEINALADYIVYDERALCRLLNTLS
jgi:phosphoserine phosphatase